MRTSTPHTFKNLTVEIASDAIWMTVYDQDGNPRGTIERPHMGCKAWRSYATDGGQAATDAIGPRTALKKLWEKING